MTTSPQSIFGERYELVRHIARGGMAQVYLAHDLFLDRPVAVKALFPELSVDEAFVQRFRREAQAAANLTHPNIVSIFDWGEGNGTYFIVMEYVDGETLSQRLRRAPLTAEDGAIVGIATASALSFAHRRNVIHRDVKPGNVLIDTSGQIKVTDFGIARAVGVSENLTQAGSVMGTASYFSPEQAQGHPVDARSDVYSLGVVLYEIIAGRAPFKGDNPVAIAYKHVREAPPPLSQFQPGIAPGYEAITMKALAKRPEDRYQTADELRTDLERFRAGRPPLALAAAPDDRTAIVAGGTAVTSVVAADQMQSTGVSGTTTYQPDGATTYQTGATTYQARSTGATGQTAIYGEEPPLDEPTDPSARRSGGEDWPGQKEPGRKSRWGVVLIAMLLVLAALVFFLGKQAGFWGNPFGSNSATIPGVAGQPQGEATYRLNQAGFKHIKIEYLHSERVKGNAIGTVPPAGNSTNKSSQVLLKISEGPIRVAVPGGLANMSVEQAKAALAKVKLKGVMGATVTSLRVPKGEVVRTNPPAGQKVDQGGTVKLIISGGPAQVQVPYIANLEASEAYTKLANVKLQWKTIYQSSTSVSYGLVIGTSPPANDTVNQGATITVYVSTGPPTVAVPSVVGDSRAAAVAALRGDGFGVRVVNQSVTESSQNGQVVSQSPSAYQQVTPGETVTIAIGVYTPPTTTTPSTTTPPTTSPPTTSPPTTTPTTTK